MPLISSTIPNLINGVSQQPAPTRIRTAGEKAENCYMSVVSGLQKRQHSSYVAELKSIRPGDVATHIVKSSTDERYAFVVDTTGTLQVYNMVTGDAVGASTDQSDSSKAYLKTDYPARDLRFTTVADQTFVSNASITVTETTTDESVAAATQVAPQPLNNGGAQAATDESAADTPRLDPASAVSIFIRRAVPSTAYTITIDDAQAATLTTQSNADSDNIIEGTAGIATRLATELEAYHTRNNDVITNIKVIGSVLTFRLVDATKNVTMTDQFGGAAVRVIRDVIQDFSDLPPMEAVNRLVKVVGDADAEGDDYWVRFNGKVWVEDVGHGDISEPTPSKMPHKIVLDHTGTDTTFTVDSITWLGRSCGDTESNANPSFVGRNINSIFLYKGRLGMLADENLIMSEVGNYENFYRTTATQILDSDRIDVASTTGSVNILRHATAFGNALVLFSDTQQFKVTQGDVLSPSTVGLQPMTTYDGSRTVPPVNSGPNVFFAVDGPRFSVVREMYIDEDNGDQFDAAEVTVQVPKYIPTGINQMAVSSYEDVLIIQAGEPKNEVYVYKWYLEGKTKVQSSWSKWIFDEGISIESLAFMDQDLVMIYTVGTKAYIDRIRLEESVALEGNQTLLLDHKVTYRSEATDNTLKATVPTGETHTKITLPFEGGDNIQFWTLGTPSETGEPTPFGLQLFPTQHETDKTVYVLDGVWTAENFCAGYPYMFNYEFSDQFVRSQSTGGDVAVQDGRLQLRYMSVVYQNSSYFLAEVLPKNRDPRAYVFNARTFADSTNRFDTVPVETGEFRFPITAQNTKVKISLKSDKPFPCAFGLAEWDGLYHPRTQRI